jgi:hypothetical protein
MDSGGRPPVSVKLKWLSVERGGRGLEVVLLDAVAERLPRETKKLSGLGPIPSRL